MHSDIDPIGDLRAALDARSSDPGAINWVAFALLSAHAALPDHEARAAATRMVRDALAQVPAGRATAAERLDFVTQGTHALTRRIHLECPWVLDAGLAARTWAAAFAWQAIVNLPDAPDDDGMHTCMGLGGGHTVAFQWDTAHDLSRVRHVIVASGSLAPGQLNTFARLEGYPGLPDHLEAFGPRHVDSDLLPSDD